MVSRPSISVSTPCISSASLGLKTGIIGYIHRKNPGIFGGFCQKHLRKSINIAIFAEQIDEVYGHGTDIQTKALRPSS
jgi:hypothetical protein